MIIRIVTDSTCDLPEEIVNQQAITVVPLHINVEDKSFLDGVELMRNEFYAKLPGYFPAPKTATPSPQTFIQVYERLADEGAQAILSIHISESLSATINSVRIAAKEFTRIPVTVLDSSQLSLGTGFLVERAAQMAQAGKKMGEILSTLQELKKRSYVFASLKTLEYLRRSGRMNTAIARLGEILQIKPLVHMNMGKATAHRTRTLRKTRHLTRRRSGRSRGSVQAGAFFSPARRSTHRANHTHAWRASRHRRAGICLYLKGVNL
jgi:DegV family protein with EDD domain